MTSADEMVARAAERKGPSEWQSALELFEGGYGDPPDLNDPTDRAVFLSLLRDEVRRTMSEELARHFTQATARLREVR